MKGNRPQARRVGPPRPADPRRRDKEPVVEQIASFVGFFIWLLVLKSYFLPLFIIPTGSMAETLYGAHAIHTCPNCGFEYPLGVHRSPGRPAEDPPLVRCPNCRWQQDYAGTSLRRQARPTSGDRIVVHGWTYELSQWLAPLRERLKPRRWDVVVFRNPNSPEQNYIKRLVGEPGDKIEIIDGDIFVNDRIARKTPQAQRSLWMPYYDQDYPPRQPSPPSGYHPRWVALEADGGWTRLNTRGPHFDGADRPRAEIQFVNQPGRDDRPGVIHDVYGYNVPTPAHNVADIRLSCEVRMEAGAGYVELSTTKHENAFYARLYADGRVTLEHAEGAGGERELWGQARLKNPSGAMRLALSKVDYVVSFEVNGETRIASSEDQYAVTPTEARAQTVLNGPPVIRIAAEGVRATFAHLRIDRDVYYTSDIGVPEFPGRPGNGTQGNPWQLGAHEYFVLGDNSPASLDGRCWSERSIGPHLKVPPEGAYHFGTVPADQMIGPAFLVYWPGFLSLFPQGPNFLPDFGRIRWIH